MRAHPEAIRAAYRSLKAIGADVTAVLAWEGSLVLRHLKGAAAGDFSAICPVVSNACDTRKPQLIHDTRRQSGYSPCQALFRSGVCIPVVKRELVVAVLFIGSKQMGAFDSRTVRLVGDIGARLERAFSTDSVLEPNKGDTFAGLWNRLFPRR